MRVRLCALYGLLLGPITHPDPYVSIPLMPSKRKSTQMIIDTDDPRSADSFPSCSRKGLVVWPADLRNTSLLSLPKRSSSETCRWRTPWHHHDTTITAGDVGWWWPCAIKGLGKKWKCCGVRGVLKLLKTLVFETFWNHMPYSYLEKRKPSRQSIFQFPHESEQLLQGLEERLVLLPVVAGASVLGAGLCGLDGLYNQTLNQTAPRVKETHHSRKITSLSKHIQVKFTLIYLHPILEITTSGSFLSFSLLCSWLASMTIGSPLVPCPKRRIHVDDTYLVIYDMYCSIFYYFLCRVFKGSCIIMVSDCLLHHLRLSYSIGISLNRILYYVK